MRRVLPGHDDAVLLRSHLAGLKTAPQTARFNGAFRMAGIRFYPHGLHQLLGLPADETIDLAASPQEVFGLTYRSWEERLFNAKDQKETVELNDHYFLDLRAKINLRPCPLTAHVLHQIAQSRGNLKMSDLQHEFKLSYKTIDRRFRKSVGLAPKRYARIYRFYCALQQYHWQVPEKLSDLAYDCGYYDQNHFIRDVKEFTHRVPKDFFPTSKEDTNIQRAMIQSSQSWGRSQHLPVAY